MIRINSMKIYKVYQVKNSNKEIVYIGHTSRTLDRRLQEHSYKTLKGLTDLTINLVDSFDTKKEARELEDQLQNLYGFETDTEKRRRCAALGIIRWDGITPEQRSELLKNNINIAWSKRDKETRSEIIKKGHVTRKKQKK